MKNKKPLLYIFAILLIIVAGIWIYWQQNKKRIIRHQIESAVNKGTDSMYYIHYDSSHIDEINGNATFYNVELQSDSLQKQLLQFDTASADVLFNVHIDQVSISGANIPALLTNNKVEANSIEIIRPVIYIISSGKKKKEKINDYNDKAIYERLLGRYNSIKAGQIIIKNGILNLSTKTTDPHTSLKDISIQLNNFRVDDTKDYDNIISYFIKDIVAKVGEINMRTENHTITFSEVEYNAPAKFIRLKKFVEKDTLQNVVFDINNTIINNIATDSFILHQQIKAGEFKTDGGLIRLYRKKDKEGHENDRIEIDNNSFDEAVLERISIGNTKIMVYNKANPSEAPFILNNVKFSATDIQSVYSGTNIRQLIGHSKWILSADGFSLTSEDKIYKYNFGAFNINNVNSTIQLKYLSIKPQIREEVFSKNLKVQKDLYDIELKNIQLSGIDTRTMITDKKILAETISFQPIIHIFNDRTVEANPASKVGKYPHQQLQAIKIPFLIKKLIIKDGYIAYKEKGKLSKQTGIVFFKNSNATITNVTNIKDNITKDNLLKLNANASFMGVSKLQTTWILPLNSSNGEFTVLGSATAFNAEALNTIAEPLGMASIKKGSVNKLEFNINGNDLQANGKETLVYKDLKMEVLKKDSSEELKKKNLMSFIANALIKNGNSGSSNIKPVEMSYGRDTTKSFFNLVWKTIFAGAKNTIQKL
ncbi:MAG: hypothetical protein ABIO04_14245 [Ferruginibacter sp.]